MINQDTLTRRQQLLTGVIDGKRQSDDELPKWVPPTLVGKLDLATRMETAAKVLDDRIAKNTTRPSGKRKDSAKIQVSLTDPIAPLGRDKRKVFRSMYTVQTMVDPTSLLVMSYCCDAATGDSGTLAKMIDKTQAITDGKLNRVLADGGYCSILDLIDAQARDVELLAPPSASGSTRKSKSRSGEIQIQREQFDYDAETNTYRCPQGEELTYQYREKKSRAGGRFLYQSTYQCAASSCADCPLAERCLSGQGARRIKRTEGEEYLEAQREKMSSDEAKASYRLRGQTVELGFGDAKGNRRVERFHGRGLDRARGETGLLILAQNLLRLDKLQREALNSMKQAA